MCGIVGEFSMIENLIDQNEFMDLINLSVNRGPDSRGYFSDHKNFQFGFNRLIVLDKSEVANQPIISKSGRFIMVYNGEVYNYLEIKKMLISEGYQFSGTGDSEVIVNAFEAFGLIKTVDLLDGMFAIGLFDNNEKKLHLIRDFAGIKPLHFGVDGPTIIFASQYDQIIKHPKFKNKSINQNVLKLYLSHQYIPPPLGLLEDTYSLLPGEIITFQKDKDIKRNRYWELPQDIKPTIFDRELAIDLLSNTLNVSINAELISDVPLAGFLSGGIDSSLVCLLAQKSMDKPLNAYTIGSHSDYDESLVAKKYANLIGLNQHIEHMNGAGTLKIIDSIMTSLTEPIADLSIIPTYLVSQLASQNSKVCLSGDGGDELFFGYERFWSIAKNFKYYNLPFAMKYSLYGTDKILSNNKNINSASLFKTQGDAHSHLHSRFREPLLSKIAPNLKNKSLPLEFDIYKYKSPKDELQLLQYMRYAEFYGMMQKTLRKVDIASMGNSLEVRVPFLKKTFIEASLKIDPYLSYGPNKGKISNKKVIIKDVLRRHLPNAPIDNIKRGFSVPISDWIKKDLKDKFNEVLHDDSMIQYFGFNKKEISKMLDAHHNNKIDAKSPIFTLFSLFNWKNNNLD